MSQRVYKETFERGETELDLVLPISSEIVHFGAQEPSVDSTTINVWFTYHEDDEDMYLRRLRIVGTGHEIDSEARYVDTLFLGPFVFHLFELPPIKKEAD